MEKSKNENDTPTWVMIAGALLALIVLAGLPWVCGACGGLMTRGYEAGSGQHQ